MEGLDECLAHQNGPERASDVQRTVSVRYDWAQVVYGHASPVSIQKHPDHILTPDCKLGKAWQTPMSGNRLVRSSLRENILPKKEFFLEESRVESNHLQLRMIPCTPTDEWAILAYWDHGERTRPVLVIRNQLRLVRSDHVLDRLQFVIRRLRLRGNKTLSDDW